jgi:MFS family permease
VRKLRIGRGEHGELAGLFFLQMMAMGIWLVPLSRILNGNGFSSIAPYAFAVSAVAAFISPLIFGAMADHHASPTYVLRGLALASAAASALSGWSIAHGWAAPAVLGFLQLLALAAVPTSSITNTIIFARLNDSQRQFGPLRAIGTFGWVCGCWLVSGLSLDASASSFYIGAFLWIGLALFTFTLPALPPPSGQRLTLRQRMGWDSTVLLKHHDHRVVFFTVALFSIPLAAFYPFTPAHLQHIGLQRTSAWMTLGQVTEIAAMFCLAGLFANWRLKWIFVAGLSVGFLRFGMCALDRKMWLLAGVTLHGFSFALVYITAQIYLNERVDSAWRARAQALMSLMSSGVGNLVGYVGTGIWFQACSRSGATRWPLFWGALSLAIGAVLLFFLIAYHGRSAGFRKPAAAGSQSDKCV